jgi:hypothetical protein
MYYKTLSQKLSGVADLFMANIRSKAMKKFCSAALLTVFLSWSQPLTVLADHPGIAPCPGTTPPSGNPPGGVVVVSILSVKPNSDLEGDDDYVPFYDNHADIYGTVTVDGETFDLPKIEDNDFPHWDTNGVFSKQVTSSPVTIAIEILESDGGITGDDDKVDINPLGGKHRLDLSFDLCALKVSGDINPTATQGIITVSGGSADEEAKIQFKVELQDGRPVTSNDLALVEVDLVQVIHHSPQLAAGKPTVVMARIANNYSVAISTNVRIRIAGGGITVDDVFPIDIQPGEVQKHYFYSNSPIVFPSSTSGYAIAVLADLEDPGNTGLPIGDCHRTNDEYVNRTDWKVVTPPRFSFLWMKVGTLLDIGNYTPDSHLQEIYDLGHAYIMATYPLAPGFTSTDISPFPLSPSITSAVDWLFTVLSAFEIPLDGLEPFALVLELNAIPVLTGHSRLMGVLPNKDWFERFTGWSEKTGVSLGEFAPRAVIFLPRQDFIAGEPPGPAMALPAHELGHTFGLSIDSALKDSWVCSIDWPVVGSLPCGAVGGFDEYESDDPVRSNGNPARGFWIAQGGEPSALSPLLNQEQCDSHCFMGPSPQNAHLNWGSRGRWIEPAGYDHLIEKLKVHPDPEIIYVSGMIAWNDQAYLGPMYHLKSGIPDREDKFGLYAIRFVDERGTTINEVGLPVNWNLPESDRPLPVTFFGLSIPFPERSRTIQIWNRGTGKLLAERPVSPHLPEVGLRSPKPGTVIKKGDKLDVRWRGKDRDKESNSLTYTILVSPSRERWWPAAYKISQERFSLQTETLEPGEYYLKVVASDGIHIGESQIASFVLQTND